MFGWFRKKPKTGLDLFIEAIYGKNPPKISANLNTAIDIAFTDLLNQKIDYRTVSAKCSENYQSGIPYNTYDLALSTALAFFMKKDEYDLDFTDQLKARMQMIEWIQQNKCNPIIAKTFEDQLYKIYKPSLNDQQAAKPKQTPKEIFNDVVTGKNTSYFTIGKRLFPHAPRTENELNEVAGFVAQDIRALLPSAAHLYQFVMCEIEGASMSDNENAQKLVEFSGFHPSEYHNALSGSPLMDEEGSATDFFNLDIFPSLTFHYNMDQAVAIRCRFMTSFINKYRTEIDEARKLYS